MIKEKDAWKVLAIKMDNVSKKNNTQTFADKELNLAINYPANWEYSKPDSSSVLFNGQQGTPDFTASVFIKMISLKQYAYSHSAQQLIKHLQQQLSTAAQDVRLLKKDKLNLPSHLKNYTGMYFIATYTQKNVAMKKLQYVIIGPNQIAYTWEYTAPAMLFEANFDNAQRMYESWIIH